MDASQEFDTAPKTGVLVREELLPTMARHTKALYAMGVVILSIAAAIFAAGASSQSCSSKYQTVAAAKEREAELAAEIAAQHQATEALGRDVIELKAGMHGLQHQTNHVEGVVDRLAEKFGVDKPAPAKHGR